MSEEWKHASWVSLIGQWAWIIGIISGVINVLIGFITIPFVIIGWGNPIWMIISGIIEILISFFIILPKFSLKCAKKDWDSLLNWVLPIGNIRFPWMLLWGFFVGIFGYGWGGLAVIIPSLVLLFAGPKPYEWKTIQ
ncbi:MAG: hypothetical protein KGD65_10820 [Candidatus Lokiarchaeota archaeon]|nr:hypothetical protein [Candidatus Lokiarchaeota archaeon]